MDEYRMMVFPIVLGSGKRVFPDAEVMSELTLTTQAEENGVLLLIYQPASR